MPSERARLRRPGSEEGEARRGDRNSCWLASGRNPGGVGTNRAGEEPVTLGLGMARLGPVGKKPVASPGKHLRAPSGKERGAGEPRTWGLGSPGTAGPGPGSEYGGPGVGVQRRRALVEAGKQWPIRAIRSGWQGCQHDQPALHAPLAHSKPPPLQVSPLRRHCHSCQPQRHSLARRDDARRLGLCLALPVSPSLPHSRAQ